MRRPDAVVVGGGLSGLVAAWRLQQAGQSVVVLEAGSEPGGHARTTVTDGVAWEWGPHTVTGTATSVHALVADLGIESTLVEPSGPSTRYIYRSGQMHPLPQGPLGMLRRGALRRRDWLRVLAEPLVPAGNPAGESVAAFFRRRIGPQAAEVLVGSFVSGIHAGDPESLGLADAFPTLARWEREHGSLVRGAFAQRGKRRSGGLRAFRNGTGTLTRTLAERLGDRIVLETPAESITAARQVRAGGTTWQPERLVVATPPPVTRALLGDWLPAADLAVPMAPIAVVHQSGRGEAPRGFGVLVPRSEGLRTLGVLFVSSQLPSRVPDGHWLLTTFLGGTTDPDVVSWSEDRLVQQARADLVTICGFRERAEQVHVIRQPAAIPQMVPGHLERVAALQAAVARVPGLALAGNWLRGVSLEHAVQSGEAAARSLLSERVAA